MALLWTDGFDRYGAAADLDLNYTRTGTGIAYAASGGVTSLGAVQIGTSSAASSILKTFVTAGTLTTGNAVHGCFYWKTDNAALTETIAKFGTDQFSAGTGTSNAPGIIATSTGAIAVTEHGSNGTTLATSTTGLIVANTFYHIEYAAKYNTSGNGGYIKVWINGNIVINFSGTTLTSTVPVSFTGFSLTKTTLTNHTTTFDDPIMWDEAGTDFALTQLTTAYLPVIETLSIDANNSVQFTPNGAATNHECADDPAFENADTDYNSSSTIGQQDSFSVANQGSTPNYTFAISVKTIAKIDVPGTVNLRDLLISGISTTRSADRLLTTSYTHYPSFYGKDPATTSVWTTTAVNSIITGYDYHS